MEVCECCRWQQVGGGSGEPEVFLASEVSDTGVSDLLYELVGMITQRLRNDGEIVLLSDSSSVALLDAANLDLAELLHNPTDDALAHGMSNVVAICFSFEGDEAFEAEISRLHAAGALTIGVSNDRRHRSESDFRVVVNAAAGAEAQPMGLQRLWRGVVKGVLSLHAFADLESSALR